MRTSAPRSSERTVRAASASGDSRMAASSRCPLTCFCISMNYRAILATIKGNGFSLLLTATLVLVVSILVILTSITIQNAYVWLALGASAVLFLGLCSCTSCDKGGRFWQRADSLSTVSDVHSHFVEISSASSEPPYWVNDQPPSYEVVTASPDFIRPPPYSAVVSLKEPCPVHSNRSSTSSSGRDKQSDATSVAVGEPAPPYCACGDCPICSAGTC